MTGEVKDLFASYGIAFSSSGLDSRTEHILEIACIITDGDLAVVKEVRSTLHR